MKSIDNLREYALTAANVNATTRAVLAGYVDEIEREVADMVPLPVDADGVPIHVGDVMEWDNGTFTVHELKVTEDGWTTWDEQHGYTVHTDETHHHAPTVEDVLREFTDEVWNRCCEGATASDSGIDELVAEYAAKLQLKED